MKRFKTFTHVAVASVVFAVTVMTGGVAGAGPIQWALAEGGNGHWYEEFDVDLDWQAARMFADSKSYLGLQGYLVTITSGGERDFLIEKGFPSTATSHGPRAWLGAYQDKESPNFSEPGGGWTWLTGEPWAFTSWDTNEPSECCPPTGWTEDYAEFHPDGRWNDHASYLDIAVVVEYSAPVPEPSTTLLFSLGLIGMSSSNSRRTASR